MKPIYTQFVHEYNDARGVARYCVAEWDEQHAQYIAPLDRRTAKLTGCSAEFAKTPAGIGGYTSRKRALARARYLFRDQIESERIRRELGVSPR